MRIIALLLALVVMSGSALAQRDFKRDGRQRQMKQEDRQRMREDIRDAYRERGERPERAERGRQMTPEERDKLRRDIENANRELRRR